MKIDLEILKSVEKDTNITEEQLVETIEQAINSAYQQTPDSKPYSKVKLNLKTGEIELFAKDKVEFPEGQEIVQFYDDDRIEEPAEFGRYAAKIARIAITNALTDAKNGYVYIEYKKQEHQLVNGVVQQVVNKTGEISPNFKLKLSNKFDAFLPLKEQTPGEIYTHGNYLKAYVTSVERGLRGPDITVSRSHPGIIRRLFETEVPELADKTVEIVSVAREAGSRTKIAVKSNNPKVNPVASLIGELGKRVRAVVEELNGEKIDIVQYNEDPAKFVEQALSPAKVDNVIIIDPANKVVEVKVSQDQKTLAIGIDGQNTRLAARLTGWKIDIN